MLEPFLPQEGDSFVLGLPKVPTATLRGTSILRRNPSAVSGLAASARGTLDITYVQVHSVPLLLRI